MYCSGLIQWVFEKMALNVVGVPESEVGGARVTFQSCPDDRLLLSTSNANDVACKVDCNSNNSKLMMIYRGLTWRPCAFISLARLSTTLVPLVTCTTLSPLLANSRLDNGQFEKKIRKVESSLTP